MLIVRFNQREIRSDDNEYSIDDMIEPRFVNLGDTDIRINHVLIKPNESFLAGVQGAIMQGSVSIAFQGNGRNRLTVFFGTKIEPKICN